MKLDVFPSQHGCTDADLAPAELPAERYKAALAAFASSIIVASTNDREGRPHGFTATAFSAVSLSPPVVQFCLANNARCFEAFDESGQFAVSILGPGQSHIAQRFATSGADKFANGDDFARRGGILVVKEAQAVLICRKLERIACGDHSIFLGQVLDADAAEVPEALVYFRRKYMGEKDFAREA